MLVNLPLQGHVRHGKVCIYVIGIRKTHRDVDQDGSIADVIPTESPSKELSSIKVAVAMNLTTASALNLCSPPSTNGLYSEENVRVVIFATPSNARTLDYSPRDISMRITAPFNASECVLTPLKLATSPTACKPSVGNTKRWGAWEGAINLQKYNPHNALALCELLLSQKAGIEKWRWSESC